MIFFFYLIWWCVLCPAGFMTRWSLSHYVKTCHQSEQEDSQAGNGQQALSWKSIEQWADIFWSIICCTILSYREETGWFWHSGCNNTEHSVSKEDSGIFIWEEWNFNPHETSENIFHCSMNDHHSEQPQDSSCMKENHKDFKSKRFMDSLCWWFHFFLKFCSQKVSFII